MENIFASSLSPSFTVSRSLPSFLSMSLPLFLFQTESYCKQCVNWRSEDCINKFNGNHCGWSMDDCNNEIYSSYGEIIWKTKAMEIIYSLLIYGRIKLSENSFLSMHKCSKIMQLSRILLIQMINFSIKFTNECDISKLEWIIQNTWYGIISFGTPVGNQYIYKCMKKTLL